MGTYNVNGRKPPLGLDLKPWLAAAPEADVVVAGFQEIVPLNASNVMNGGLLPASVQSACRTPDVQTAASMAESPISCWVGFGCSTGANVYL